MNGKPETPRNRCHIRATWEKKSYLTADNQMSRRPNLALNADIEAVVHWTRNN